MGGMIKTLAASLRENKKPALLTLIIIMGEVFFEVLIPFYTADMVNMIKAGAPLSDVTALGGKLALMAVLSLLCGAMAARTCSECGGQELDALDLYHLVHDIAQCALRFLGL